MRTPDLSMISRIAVLLVVAVMTLPWRAAAAQQRAPSRFDAARAAVALDAASTARLSQLGVLGNQCSRNLKSAALTGVIVGAAVVLAITMVVTLDFAMDPVDTSRKYPDLVTAGLVGGALGGGFAWWRSCPHPRAGA